MVKEIAGQILSLSALADIPLENSNRVHSSKKKGNREEYLIATTYQGR